MISKRNKSNQKLISLYEDDINIIEKELNAYGDFSNFVRYCLKQPQLINNFKNGQNLQR